MAFPWNRNYDPNQQDAPPRTRRGRNRRGQREEARRQSARAEEERRRQRLALTVGGMLVLIVFFIVGFGYYREFYQPPRVLAGQINNVRFNMGDLVDRIRVLQGLNRYEQGGFVDLSVVPFEYLQDMLNAEILRQQAPLIGISVSEEDIDEALKRQFYPPTQGDQEVTPGQLEQEYRNNYQTFLTATNLSDEQYRVLVEEQLLTVRLAGVLGQDIPEEMEQAEVAWIVLDPEGSVAPADVKARLDEGEDFNDVAAEVSTPQGFAQPPTGEMPGYVGWVPPGAFPRLDSILFGDEEDEVVPLAAGEVSDPVFTQEGIFIVKKLSDPEERELTGLMRFKLNQELLNDWQEEQLSRGSDEGWLKINFDSNRYAWVADQVRLTAPRTPPRQPAQGAQGF